jgi:hypothetical protein
MVIKLPIGKLLSKDGYQLSAVSRQRSAMKPLSYIPSQWLKAES